MGFSDGASGALERVSCPCETHEVALTTGVSDRPVRPRVMRKRISGSVGMYGTMFLRISQEDCVFHNTDRTSLVRVTTEISGNG